MGTGAVLSDSNGRAVIRTPDQRLRVFVSSTLKELAEERQAVRRAIANLRLAPVMFESGARPHPATQLYQAYLAQSHIFVGIYWQSYGWVAPEMDVSGLEDEYNLAAGKPTLIYVKTPAEKREPGLTRLLDRIKSGNAASYKYFSSAEQLEELVENDLVLVLTEYFEAASASSQAAHEQQAALSNVPIPRNPLIDRERELASARDLLLKQDAALVTLTGFAGAGKSRLGIQLALDLRDQFRDGAYLVRLSPIQDAQLVQPTIAKALGLKEGPGPQSLIDALKAYLAGKQVLLLLDNFEHVMSAAPDIADLLEASPSTKTIITSRAPLQIRPERELIVPPLALPPRGAAIEPQDLLQYSAVQLFVQRAQNVNMDFQLTAENAAAVVEICHRLDGLPLAIELAAARTRMLPPQSLLKRLENRFEVLRGDSRDRPARQRTLYEAIDWSYSLLSHHDKRLLRCLSVFAGTWTFESADAICNAAGQPPVEVLDGIERLMNNSLLKPAEEVRGELRMKQFETVREFAHQHLVKSGEAQAVGDRYIQYYVDLAARAEEGLSRSSGQEWHERIDAELDNLRGAMRLAMDAGQGEFALGIATALWRFWWRNGRWSEGLQCLNAGLRSKDVMPLPLRAKALTQSGWLHRFMGDFAKATALLEESLSLWRQTTDTSGLALALGNLAASVMRYGDMERATKLAQEALDLSPAGNDSVATYFSLQVFGQLASRQGNSAKAIGFYQDALALAQRAGDDDHSANLLNDLGDEYMTAGNYEQAEVCFARAATISQRLGNRFVSAFINGNRGAIALKKGNYPQAFELLAKCMGILKEMGDKENTVQCLEAFAFVAQGCHLWERAARLLGAHETLRQAIGFSRSQPMQADHDASIAVLVDRLGQPAFDAAWAEGSRMTYDEATAYAVDPAFRPEA